MVFGIPEWGIGLAVAAMGLFMGIGLMMRLMPQEMRVPRKARLTQAEQDMLEDLHRRLGEVEAIQKRLEDVEDRIEFTERLLASHREAERLGKPEH